MAANGIINAAISVGLTARGDNIIGISEVFVTPSNVNHDSVKSFSGSLATSGSDVITVPALSNYALIINIGTSSEATLNIHISAGAKLFGIKPGEFAFIPNPVSFDVVNPSGSVAGRYQVYILGETVATV